jgi:putative hydrolase of the HAD superfamily
MKALVFDMDDTLVVEMATAEAVFLETCEWARKRFGIDPGDLHATLRETCRSLWRNAPARQYCVDVGISSWEGLWGDFLGDDENLQALRAWAPHYRQISWHGALLKHGVDDSDFAGMLAAHFKENRPKRHIVYEDVYSELPRLGQVYKLGLLSNGAPDVQRTKIEGSGIEQYFEAIVISGEMGFGKPDTRVFDAILNRLGAQPAEATMIGNSLKSDVAGAQAAGMRAIWLNRDGKPRDDSIIPDREIKSLYELGGAL